MNSDSNKVESNNITITNDNARGIYTNGAHFNEIRNNTILTSGGGDSRGIEMTYPISNIIENNNITTSESNGHGIFLGGTGYDNNISKNKIRTGHFSAYSIYVSGELQENNTFYNNLLNHSRSDSGVYWFRPPPHPNYWNTTKTSAFNIMGTPYIAGNYWTNTSGEGYSDICADIDKDGICDGWLTLSSGWDSQGIVDSGYYFDGTEGHINMSNDNSLDLTTTGTVAVWAKIEDYSTGIYWNMLGKGGAAGFDTSGYTIFYSASSETLRGVLSNATGGTEYVTVNFGKPNTGEWYHLVFTWNGTNLLAYLNGTLVDTDTQDNNAESNNYNFMIGRSRNTDYFNGNVDEVRIWNRSLSSTEIADMYTNETAGIYDPNMNRTGLVLEVSMNVSNPYVATMVDTSGLGNDGTIYNGGKNFDALPLAKYTNECGSCSECTLKIQSASLGTTVLLNQSISDQVGNCIEFDGADQVTFDCQGFTIDGDSSYVDYGVWLNYSSDNNIIRNCIITDFANGIYLYNYSDSNIVENNTITTTSNFDGGHGIWVRMYSDSNNITNNTITTSGTDADGIYIRSTSNFNIVENNTITTSGTRGYGVYIYPYVNSTVLNNNNITTTGESGTGIYILTHSDLNNLTNNTITTSNNYGRGVIISDESDYMTIINNTIKTTGVASQGFYLNEAEKCEIVNNTLNTTWADAFYFDVSNTVAEWNHNITNNTEQGEPIYYYFDQSDIILEDTDNIGQLIIANSTNMTVRNLTMDKDGIIFSLTDNSRIENSTINVSSYIAHGILMYYPISNNMTNNTVETSEYGAWGVRLRYGDGNLLDNNTITTAGNLADGVSMYQSANNTITNNDIYTTNGYAINVPGFTTLDYYNHTMENNTEFGEPIYYYFDQSDIILE
ncbi:MAG: right-handed parallel beta-helix repeat-containing protein, partial [Candidatus Peribacteraceae bacterium]|nr:right-handed parallel beta-helix repeat-containing protein [Candidatus Peribacteraceae bacterium]